MHEIDLVKIAMSRSRKSHVNNLIIIECESASCAQNEVLEITLRDVNEKAEIGSAKEFAPGTSKRLNFSRRIIRYTQNE